MRPWGDGKQAHDRRGDPEPGDGKAVDPTDFAMDGLGSLGRKGYGYRYRCRCRYN